MAAAARLLGPAGLGDFVIIVAGLGIGVQILNLGLSSSLLVLFSSNRSLISHQIWRLRLGCLACALILFLLGLSVESFVGDFEGPFLKWWTLWATWIPIRLLRLYHGASLHAIQASRAISVIEIGGKISALVLGLTSLLLFPGLVVGFVFALIISDVLILVAEAVFLRKGISRVADAFSSGGTARFLRNAIRLGLRAFPVLVLPYTLLKIDIFLLREYRGAAEAGIYSVAAQIIDCGLILPGTVAALGVATVVISDDRSAVILKLLRPVFFLALLASVILLAFGRVLVVLFFGRFYEDAYLALVILLPGFILLSSITILSQYFAARGYPLIVSLYWGTGLLVNVVLNLLSIPFYGMTAAAATSSLAYGLVFAFMCNRFLKESSTSAKRLLY